jgi:hypothetical protein
MFAGEQHLPKVSVLFGNLFDTSNVASHFLPPCCNNVFK